MRKICENPQTSELCIKRDDIQQVIISSPSIVSILTSLKAKENHLRKCCQSKLSCRSHSSCCWFSPFHHPSTLLTRRFRWTDQCSASEELQSVRKALKLKISHDKSCKNQLKLIFHHCNKLEYESSAQKALTAMCEVCQSWFSQDNYVN